MQGNTYRTGAAARILGITQYELRRLHEAQLIQAEATSTGQLRFPESEILRLQKEGVPPMPAPAGDQRRAAATTAGTDVAPRRRAPTHAQGDKVRDSEDAVKLTENQIRKRKLDYELEAVEDRFREKQEQERQELAHQDEVERLRREDEARKQWREVWERGYLYTIMKALPERAPIEVRNQIRDAVLSVLPSFDPETEEVVLHGHLAAACWKVLAPWLRQEDVEAIIRGAVGELPIEAKGVGSRSNWELSAALAARTAVGSLSDDVSLGEVKLVASQAVEPVTRKFQHEQMLLTGVKSVDLQGATADEKEEAAETVRRALSELPIGTTQRQLRQAADTCLEPLRDRISRRKDAALRQEVACGTSSILPWGLPEDLRQQALDAVQAELEQAPRSSSRGALEDTRKKALEPFLAAHAQRRRKAELIRSSLGEVSSYVYSTSGKHDPAWRNYLEVQRLRPIVEARLIRDFTGEETIEAAKRRIRELAKELASENRQ